MNAATTCNRVMLALLLLATGACSAGETDSGGGLEVRVNDEAVAADAGLPHYPGSRPYTDHDDSSSAANIRLSTSLFGFKVVALNLETPDKPERVAAFYRKALSRYGRVLDCSEDTSKGPKSEPRNRDSDELTCDDDGDAHSTVYKVGTKKNQRIVAIKPHGEGTRFSLAHVDVRD